MHPLNQKLDTEFRAALAAVIEPTALEGRYLDQAGSAGCLSWLQLPGATDGYYAYAVLGQEPALPSDLWITSLAVSHVAEDEPSRPAPLDVRLTGSGSRDGGVLAAMVLTAVLADLKARDLA